MSRINIKDYLTEEKESACSLDIEANQDFRDEMLEAFTLYDKAGTGFINTKDLSRVIRSLGQIPTLCEEIDIVAEYAQNNITEIDFIEFVKLVSARWRRTFDEDDELRESFRSFDKEENGFVTEKELREMLTTTGEPLSHKEVDEWLEDGKDFIQDGRLYYDDFVTFMLSK